jgi:hypothetical protein
MTHTEGNWKAFTDNANGFGVTNGNTQFMETLWMCVRKIIHYKPSEA